jgi:hypothetical protein
MNLELELSTKSTEGHVLDLFSKEIRLAKLSTATYLPALDDFLRHTCDGSDGCHKREHLTRYRVPSALLNIRGAV